MAWMVTSAVVDALLREARGAHPLESCGLLFGANQTITSFQPTANVHPDPERHFEIDPQALIDAYRRMREGGACIVGYYHSHPDGPAAPSATDRAMAAADGKIWAIVGQGEVRLWRAAPDGFSALSYTPV